ncbi:MAG TPA: Hsp20/alpha crystallin family protein [Ignavibacteria bacterium]
MNLVRFKKDTDLFNDAFKSVFHSPFFSERTFDTSNILPKVRITEDKDNFYINLEMPGVVKEDMKISLENNILSISGTKKQTKKMEETNLIMNEIYFGEFSRSFTVTDEIRKDNIEAEFKDGVLNIVLPKVEEAKPVIKEIAVK